MLLVRKGKKRERIFSVHKCKDCGAIYISIVSSLFGISEVSDKYDKDTYKYVDRCEECRGTIVPNVITAGQYEEMFTGFDSVNITTKCGIKKKASMNDIYVFV